MREKKNHFINNIWKRKVYQVYQKLAHEVLRKQQSYAKFKFKFSNYKLHGNPTGGTEIQYILFRLTVLNF